MRKILIGIVAMSLIGGAYWYFYLGGGQTSAAPADTAAAAPALPAVTEGDAVISDAVVVPVESSSLNWTTSGMVVEVLVEEGDKVAKNAPLARLDTRSLELAVEQANVALAQAQADYAKLEVGATPEQIAAAEAEIARAQGQLRQTSGSVTPQDVAAAKAGLEEARAALAQLQAGPKTADVQIAQAALDRAETAVQSQRDSLSAAKTSAQLQMEQAANTLRDKQAEVSRIHWDNRDLEGYGKLPQERVDLEEAAKRAVATAEQALELARIAFEQAQQAEVTGIQTAEAQVRDAQASLDKLMAGTDADKLAAARARVSDAQARLAGLQGEEHSGNVAAASASVASAQARLNELKAATPPTDLASGKVRIQSAEVALKQAELNLEQATLRAPLAGTVAEINLKVGEVPKGTEAAIVLADLSTWQIETSDLTELSIVKVREGAAVSISFDSLPDYQLPGVVSEIKDVGKNKQGDITYTVVVTPKEWDERLRWNMTASVAIETK